MDEFVGAKIENTRNLERSGSTAVLTTKCGNEYHVWIGDDGAPVVQRAASESSKSNLVSIAAGVFAFIIIGVMLFGILVIWHFGRYGPV